MIQNLEPSMSRTGQASALRKLARRLRRQVERALFLDVVKYQGLYLPPRYLRSNGKDFRDDAFFVESARHEALRLVENYGLQKTSDILDIGCGAGRLPIGFIASEIKVGRYSGVDINPNAIQWCKKYITKKSPNFTFHLIHAGHKKYNPDGKVMDETFALPFKDRSFDVIYLYGIFAVMDQNDTSVYCKEFNRLLREGGNIFLTAFIEENVCSYLENPEEYPIPIEGPLNAARYSKENFYSIVQSAGFKVEAFEHQTAHGGQSVVHLRHA